ncbi:hypothetical protein [uncultured Nocardioides sp.]|uniref:hypothetical protein n=1 Tax=uncultured Nocardioides sp. TaxID=198441 RepID=UPI00260FB3AA|nr:hypothetical protein [uncultured Nocardioides sp.]
MSDTAALPTPPTTDRAHPGRPHRAGGRSVGRAVAVLTGPALLLTSELLAPRFPAGLDTAGEGAFLLAHQGRFTAASLLGSLAGVLLAVSVVLVAARTPGRGRRPLWVAAGCAVLGGAGLTMHHATTLGGLDALAGGATPESLVPMAEGPGAAASILGLVVGTTLVAVLLAVAARRSRRTGWWPLAVAVLGVAANLSGFAWGTVAFVIAIGVLLAVHLRPAPCAGGVADHP